MDSVAFGGGSYREMLGDWKTEVGGLNEVCRDVVLFRRRWRCEGDGIGMVEWSRRIGSSVWRIEPTRLHGTMRSEPTDWRTGLFVRRLQFALKPNFPRDCNTRFQWDSRSMMVSSDVRALWLSNSANRKCFRQSAGLTAGLRQVTTPLHAEPMERRTIVRRALTATVHAGSTALQALLPGVLTRPVHAGPTVPEGILRGVLAGAPSSSASRWSSLSAQGQARADAALGDGDVKLALGEAFAD